MNHHFPDIKELTDKKPIWYDSNGVPRYRKFHYNLSPNIYACEVVLIKIRCQSCKEEFLVEMNWARTIYFFSIEKLSERLLRYKNSPKSFGWSGLHYGDPPCHGCVGDSMNVEDLEVLEFWHSDNWNWKRREELEIKIWNEENQ